MAGLHFDITGDNKNLLRNIEGSKQGIRSLTREAEKESKNLDDIMKRIGQSAAAIGVGFSATQLIRDVARVRGEFQQLEVALNTMLGSEEKANALFQQLVNTAAKTPFDLKGVAGGAKQLLAYGVAAEEVNDTIIRLGDIAAGLSIPLGDLVYLYGTTMTQGRLFTQDLRQFMGRGIPLADELAKQFGVAKDEVGGLVTAGKVGFPEVEKAIRAMTSEGGKFAGLMENQSKTITGQISNLEDAVDSMFNEIGKSSQGAISGVLSTTTQLVENYKQVLDIIGGIVVAFGSYKAVLAATAAFDGAAAKAKYSIEAAELMKILPLKEASANADIQQAVTSGKLTEAEAEKAIAIREEAKAYLEKLEAARIATAHDAAVAMENKRKNQEDIDKLQEQIGKLRELGKTKEADAETTKLQSLMNKQQTLAVEAETAVEIANKAATDAETVSTQINTATQNANTASTNLLTAAKMKLAAAGKAVAATLSNPYVLAAAAVAALAFGIYKVVTAKSAEEKAIERVNKKREEENKRLEDHKNKVSELISTIKDETRTTTEQANAYEELKKIAPKLTEQYTFLELQAVDSAEALKKFNEQLDRQRFTEATKSIERYRAMLKEVEDAGGDWNNISEGTRNALDELGLTGMTLDNVAENLKAEISNIQGTIDAFYKGMESRRPIEIKIQIAEGEVALIQKDFDNIKAKYDEAKAKFDKGEITFFDYKQIEFEYQRVEKRLKDAQNLRDKLIQGKPKSPNYGEEYDKAEKAWQDAAKALKDATNNRSEYTKEQYKELVKKEKDAAEAFKELGGDPTGKQQKKEDDAAKKKLEAQQKLADQLIALKLQTNNEIAGLEEDDHEREMKQIQSDYDERIAEIQKMEREWKEAQGGTLTPEQRQALDDAYSVAYEKRNKEEAKANKKNLESMLADVMTYQQARDKVEKDYAKERKKLESTDGVTKENLSQHDENRDKALQAIDEKFASESQVYLGWLESISDMTIVQLNRALGKAQAELESFEGKSDTNPEDLARARAQIAVLQKKIEQLEGKGKAETRTIDTWKDLGDVLGETASEFESLGDAIGGTTGEIISSLGSTFTSTVGLMNNIVQFVEICDKGIMNTAGTAVSAVKAVEAASVILAVISAAIQIIQKIADVAKNLHNKQYEKTIEDNQKKIDGLKESYNELEEAASKAYSSDKVIKLRDMNEKLEEQNRLIQEQKEAEESKKGDVDTSQYDEAMEANRKQMAENKEAMEEAIFGEDIQSAIENFADAYAEALEGNMDMNATAKEQAVRMMKNMVMESIKEYVAGSKKMEQIRAKMDALYADGVFSEADQKLIIGELEQFNKELDERFGWAEDLFNEEEASSSSSKRGIATASQESVDENNGRLMSIQLSMGEIKEQMIYTVTYLASMSSGVATGNNILSDIREQAVRTNRHLEDIVKYTKPLNDKISEVVSAINKINSK